MGRLKVLGIFAFLGFIGGIAADTVYNEVFPMILNIYPEILQAEWIFSGVAGSFFVTIMVVLWAHLSNPS